MGGYGTLSEVAYGYESALQIFALVMGKNVKIFNYYGYYDKKLMGSYRKILAWLWGLFSKSCPDYGP